jgi:hypothetical protein
MAVIQRDLLAGMGQVWELKLLPFGILIGSIVILIAIWFREVLPRPYLLSVLLVGIALDLAALPPSPERS